MALLDVLQARTDRRHRTAQVDCGELGLLSVGALPPAELARLQTDRAVLYAACRELQSAGESLRRAGKIFAPDEIMAYLSDGKAAAGARTVREISGVSGSRAAANAAGAGATGKADAAETDSGTDPPGAGSARTESGEIRLDSVQAENHVYAEPPHPRKPGASGVRPDSVQTDDELPTAVGTDFSEIRLSSVQTEAETSALDSGAEPLRTVHGQDSREFSEDASKTGKTNKKAPGIVDLTGRNTPNLGQNPVRPEDSGLSAAHETKSEIPEKLHEPTSESSGFGADPPHEIKSELGETMHETKSEIHPAMWKGLHETTSE